MPSTRSPRRRRLVGFVAGLFIAAGSGVLATTPASAQPAPPPVLPAECHGPAVLGSLLIALDGVPQDDNGATPGGNPLSLDAVLAGAQPGQLLGITWTPVLPTGCEAQIVTMAFHAAGQPFFVDTEVQPLITAASTGAAGGVLNVLIPTGTQPKCFVQGDLVTGAPLQVVKPADDDGPAQRYNGATFVLPAPDNIDRLVAKGYVALSENDCLQPPADTTTSTTAPAPEETTTTTAPAPEDDRTCDELGVTDIPAGDPLYSVARDGDLDGVACESDRVPPSTTIVAVTTPLPTTSLPVVVVSELPFTAGKPTPPWMSPAAGVMLLGVGLLLAVGFGLVQRRQAT